jgi:hypothetical protein
LQEAVEVFPLLLEILLTCSDSGCGYGGWNIRYLSFG